MARSATAAGLAARISASPRARCSPLTSSRSDLPRGHRDLLQRSEGQVRAGHLRDLGSSYKTRLRSAPQAARSDGGRIEGPDDRRRRQGRGGRWRIFRRLCEACQPERAPPTVAAGTSPASARASSSSASGTAIRSRPCSALRATPPAFIKSRIAKGTKVNADEAGHGIACTPISKWPDQSRGSLQPRRRLHE